MKDANARSHVLTYAEIGFSPLSIHAERFGIGREVVAEFSKRVNERAEIGSLLPFAPISAVPRKLVRDSHDIDALASCIGDFLRANRDTIKARHVIFDFRTPSVPRFVVSALHEAIVSGEDSLIEEVLILEM
jgi:hypothetical protein